MKYFVIDLDGPNYPFLKNLALVMAELTGRPLDDFPNVQDEWSGFMDAWRITPEQFGAAYAVGVRCGNLLWDGEPVDGAVEGWKALMDMDDTFIHVVTDRSPFGAVDQAHEATNYWLAINDLLYDELTFTGDKVTAVLANIEELGLSMENLDIRAIDDRPSNCLAYHEAGFYSVVYDEPSNRDLDLPRVSSMLEFANLP